MMNYIKKRYGFTLIELMVVIIVIGILASFAIPRFSRAVERTHRQDAENQLIALHAANNIYRAQTGGRFVPGSNLSIADINSNLGINLVANGMIYEYNRSSNSTYQAWAERDPANTFTVILNQNPISDGGNPSCTGPSNICDD